MSWPLVWRRNRDADVAAATAETGRLREQRDKAVREQETAEFNRKQITDLYSELYDEHERAVRRNQSLCALLDEAKTAAGVQAEARRQADRIARLCRAVTKARAEAAEDKRRADHLQARWDDLLGLNTPAIDKGASWQDRREQRMRFDKPTTEEATAS